MYFHNRSLLLIALSCYLISLCISTDHFSIKIISFKLTKIPKLGAHLRINTSSLASPMLSYQINGDLQIILPNTYLPHHIVNALKTIKFSDTLGVQLVQRYPASNDICITVMSRHRLGFVMERFPDHISFVMRKCVDHNGPLENRLVVVDPGHGGHDLGAEFDGYSEKTITLEMGLKLRKILENDGATVVMTRDKDVYVGLNTRPALANELNADYFISIHNNSDYYPNVKSGIITFYHMQEGTSKDLANYLQNAIVKVSGLHSYCAQSDSTLYNIGLAVLRGSNMPAILVEVAYINNRFDRSKLINPKFQKTVMNAIANGLISYNSTIRPTTLPPLIVVDRKLNCRKSLRYQLNWPH